MNISQNDLQNHIKKNSCVLYSNDIRKMYYKLKEKTNSQNYNNINNKRKDQNFTSRQNNSLNSKQIVNTKAYFFSRPYIKQLSQYSFLTSRKKNSKDNFSIPRLNESKDFEKNEKDDKTNIYFNLIKTYYDENGIKLKPKKKEIYPMNNENYCFKKIKAKKKKKNNNINIDKKEQNKIKHTNWTLFFPENKKEENNNKDKLNITYRKIIKIDNNNSIIKKKTSSSSECNYNKKVKDLITSPSKSEKSFNIFFQNKSGDYIINDIKKNPLITNDNDNLNNDNTSSLSVIANNSNIPFPKNKEKKKNLSNIIAYFNKRVNDLKFVPAKKISEIILSPQFNSSSCNSLNNQIQNRRHNTCIFHKKKISDLFTNDKHNIKNLKAIKKKPSLELSHVASFRYPKRKLNKQHNNNSGKIIKQHIINLSLNTINNNNNSINMTNMKISPKRLEKYFNPNQTSKEDLSYKFKYQKNPTETENIDINNVTFKKPFNNVKNIKLRNNSNKELNKKNKTDVNKKNSKNIIPLSNKNKYNNNNNKIINNLSHNISYNHDKQTESILINNNSNIMKYYRIKNMIKKYKEIPCNRKKEKIRQNQNINSLKGETTINNKCDENIININQKKYIISYYNSKNTDINIIKEKLKKYVLLNNTKKDSKSKKYNVNNQKLLSEIDFKNNMINGFISPRNNQSNISINISQLNQ